MSELSYVFDTLDDGFIDNFVNDPHLRDFGKPELLQHIIQYDAQWFLGSDVIHKVLSGVDTFQGVYFISCPQLCIYTKIGISKDIYQRLRSFTKTLGEEVYLVAIALTPKPRELERLLHAILEEVHISLDTYDAPGYVLNKIAPTEWFGTTYTGMFLDHLFYAKDVKTCMRPWEYLNYIDRYCVDWDRQCPTWVNDIDWSLS